MLSIPEGYFGRSDQHVSDVDGTELVNLHSSTATSVRRPLVRIQGKDAKLEMFPSGGGHVLARTVSVANARIFRVEQIGPDKKKDDAAMKIYFIPRRPVLAGDMHLVIKEIGSFRVARLGVEHPIHATPGWKLPNADIKVGKRLESGAFKVQKSAN